MEVINMILSNVNSISTAILLLLGAAEIIVRLTPTEKDDGAIERVGAKIRKFFDLIKVPNNKKKDNECPK